MAEDNDTERTEDPTQKRLDDAQAKGDVAKSQEVNTWFMIAGATAVQVGTANFVDPFIWSKLLDGMRDYLKRHSIARIADLVGTVDTSTREKQWISS